MVRKISPIISKQQGESEMTLFVFFGWHSLLSPRKQVRAVLRVEVVAGTCVSAWHISLYMVEGRSLSLVLHGFVQR